MKNLGRSMVSGLIGIGIGMIWFGVEVLFSLNGRNIASATVYVSSLIFWIFASFVIGIFFYVASFVFDKDDWSLRKQIIVNFFVCLIAWLIFAFALNDFVFSWLLLTEVIGKFLLMYAIAYGAYLLHLFHEVREINNKLKEK
ncbi:DUF3021 domain-containing protein [uncultured Lactobacillus sp.]|uniref:DUF3021 domain-containing protein n=1 Tax=uncultured Lactobacillus sp. TaxID=153152 RepID=UPI00263510F5|nr:DUF3021 domain-containing protein [uncultured Lactobacillus sp.]